MIHDTHIFRVLSRFIPPANAFILCVDRANTKVSVCAGFSVKQLIGFPFLKRHEMSVIENLHIAAVILEKANRIYSRVDGYGACVVNDAVDASPQPQCLNLVIDALLCGVTGVHMVAPGVFLFRSHRSLAGGFRRGGGCLRDRHRAADLLPRRIVGGGPGEQILRGHGVLRQIQLRLTVYLDLVDRHPYAPTFRVWPPCSLSV